MVFSLLGSLASYLLLIVATDITTIALSRLIGGAMAGNFGAAQAYIADSTDEKTRGKFIGYFGAAMGLGFVLGPLLGSWLGGTTFASADLVSPALAAASLSLVGLGGVIFFVRESAPARITAESKGVVNKRPVALTRLAALVDSSNPSYLFARRQPRVVWYWDWPALWVCWEKP